MKNELLLFAIWVWILLEGTKSDDGRTTASLIDNTKKAEIRKRVHNKKQGKKKLNRSLIKEPQEIVGAEAGDMKLLKNVMISERHKLVFCPIEKVASSQFKQLFYRLADDELWFEPPYHKHNLSPIPVLSDFSLDKITEIMNDPTWTKAVLFRDPVKRLLSSYLHLLVNPKTPARYRTYLTSVQQNVTWENFVAAVTDEKEGWDNIHWMRQTEFCRFDKFWAQYNFVGNYENIQEFTKELSSRVGIDNYTHDGWAITSRFKMPVLKGWPPYARKRNYIRLNQSLVNDGKGDCMWCNNFAPHKNNYTASGITISRQIWDRVRNSKYFRRDYDIFAKLTAPPFNPVLYDTYASSSSIGNQSVKPSKKRH